MAVNLPYRGRFAGYSFSSSVSAVTWFVAVFIPSVILAFPSNDFVSVVLSISPYLFFFFSSSRFVCSPSLLGSIIMMSPLCSG